MTFITAGSLHAFFRGNGANVLKIAPETALKLTFNDKLKGLLVADLHNIRPHERMFVGALAGASAQVGRRSFTLSESVNHTCFVRLLALISRLNAAENIVSIARDSLAYSRSTARKGQDQKGCRLPNRRALSSVAAPYTGHPPFLSFVRFVRLSDHGLPSLPIAHHHLMDLELVFALPS
jgi:hypothetical protein